MAHVFGAPSIAPSPAPADPVATDFLPHPPNHTFYLMHPARSWECVETDKGYEWLPRLKILAEMPGSNGVRQMRGHGNGDSTNTRVSAAAQGFTVIPRSELPREILDCEEPALPAAAGGTYMVRYRAKRGYLHVCRWDVPRVVGAAVVFEINYLQKWAFQRWLVTSGLVAPPDAGVVDMAIRVKRHRVRELGRGAHIPAVRARLDERNAELDGMAAAAESQQFSKPLDITATKAALLDRAETMGIVIPPRFSKPEILKAIQAGVPK